MNDCKTSITQMILPILSYSGQFLERFGQYHECLQKQGMNYNFVSLGPEDTKDTSTSVFVGLCLPNTCSTELIQDTITTILKTIHYPLQVASINNNVPGYEYQYSWAFYLTILIFLTLLFLVIISSIFTFKNKLNVFSIKQSTKYFKRNEKSNLNVFNGIKSLSMMWVVFGHVYSNGAGISLNINTLQQVFLKPYFLIIQAGIFAVDVFFYVGGFLLAYVFMRDQIKSKLKYPLAILQRFLRFWPCYIFTILIYYSVYLHLGSGPLWGSDQIMVRWCQKPWKPFLFIDNLVNNGQTQCMGWGWYLQNDMQLFIYSLFILFVYTKFSRFASKVIILFSIVFSMLFTFMYTYKYQIPLLTHFADAAKQGYYFLDVYIKPWARCPPYLYGLFMGIIYCQYVYKKKQEIKNNEFIENGITKISQNNFISTSTFLGKLEKIFKQNKSVRIFIEWFGIAVTLFLIFIPRTLQIDDDAWPQYAHSLYYSTAKVVFVMALSIITLPSILGCKNSFILFITDTKLFNFISKISFCTYLIHYILITIWVNRRTYDKYYSYVDMFVQYSGLLVVSCLCGAFMTFLIEIPFATYQKMLIKSLKSDKNMAKSKNVKNENIENTTNTMNKTLLNKSTVTL